MSDQASSNGHPEPQPDSSAAAESHQTRIPEALMPNRASKASQTGESSEEKKRPANPLSFLDADPQSLVQSYPNAAMDKMFQDLERTLMESTKGIDEMNKRMEQERKDQERVRDTAHVPAQLKSAGRSMESLLEDLCASLFDANGGSGRRPKLRYLDQRASAVLCCQSLAAWLSSSGCGADFAKRMQADLTDWIPKVWRLGGGELAFHMDKRDSLVLACRRALLARFPTLLESGFECLFSKPPVIYLHPTASARLLDYLACQLCLPKTCFRVLPGSMHNADCIDHSELQRIIEADSGEGRTPLFVHAMCGTRTTGSYDRLGRISTVCRQQRVWLHVQGLKLAQLALNSVPTSLRPLLGGTSAVSSCLMEFDQWLGYPGLVSATVLRVGRDGALLHQKTEEASAAAAKPKQQQSTAVASTASAAAAASTTEAEGPADDDLALAEQQEQLQPLPTPADIRSLSYQPMSLLPLWFALQATGYDSIQERARNAELTVKATLAALQAAPEIEVIKLPSLSDDDLADIKANSNLLGQLLSYLIDFELAPTVILFRYCPPELRYEQEGTHVAAKTQSATIAKAKSAGVARAPYAVYGPNSATLGSKNGSASKAAEAVEAADEPAVDETVRSEEERLQQQLMERRLLGDNRWLADSLRAAVPHLQSLSVTRIRANPAFGARCCIRFCPLETCVDWLPEHVDGLSEALASSLSLLDSTRRARPEFIRLANATEGRLLYVDMPDWPGLGGLRYKLRADDFGDAVDGEADVADGTNGTDEGGDEKPLVAATEAPSTAAAEEEEAVNRDLAAAVRAADTGYAWSPESGCIRCGLVPEDADLPSLVRRVLESGAAATDARLCARRLDALVRRRIMEAESALRREQQRRLAEAGALRQVPFLDSVVNWLSPPVKNPAREAGSGAAFSLQSGRLTSTELTYKYKMQVNGGPGL